jgi:ABC-type nitrate/sulfonate/bicarbonate transport system substrate-binding protein
MESPDFFSGADVGTNTLIEMRVLLDWKRDAKHAILAEAERSGGYASAGIRVELIDPAEKSADSLTMVCRGAAEVAINYPHNIMCMQDACPGIVSFGALVKKNPEGLLSLAQLCITNPRDLAGKKVGIGPSPVSRAQFDMFLQASGLKRESVDIATVGFEGEQLLLDGRIDALDAVAYAIPRTRRKGQDTNFIFYSESGIPDSPFLVFAARKEWLSANLQKVKDFLVQTEKAFHVVESWKAAEWQFYVRNLPERNGDEEMEVWEATCPLMKGTGPLFHQDLEALGALDTMLLRRGLTNRACKVDEVFRNFER